MGEASENLKERLMSLLKRLQSSSNIPDDFDLRYKLAFFVSLCYNINTAGG